MRRKMTADEKRNSPIGIKVKAETRKQLDYISEAEGHTLSTYIDIVLRKHIEDYLSSHNTTGTQFLMKKRRTNNERLVY